MLLRRLAGKLEGEFEHPVDADAREHRFLHHYLTLGAGEDSAADGGIFAFGVFAHDPEVDIAGLSVGERCGHAGQPTAPKKIASCCPIFSFQSSGIMR